MTIPIVFESDVYVSSVDGGPCLYDVLGLVLLANLHVFH